MTEIREWIGSQPHDGGTVTDATQGDNVNAYPCPDCGQVVNVGGCKTCRRVRATLKGQATRERALVVAWLGRPEVVERINALEGSLRCDSSYPVGLQAALRQLAEEGK